MTLSAVQALLRDSLDGLQTPGADLAAARAFITPPNPGVADAPLIYIWAGRVKEARRTLGRGVGLKRIEYELAIHAYAEMLADDAAADNAFPLFLEALLGVLRDIAMPQQLVDAETGIVSQLLEIGEQIDLTYGVPQALTDQRLLWYNAQLTVRATEDIIA